MGLPVAIRLLHSWAAACLLGGLVLRCRGQVRVMAPDSLVQQFHDTHGRIEGSTSTFGAPFYGDRVLGRLVYGESTKNHSYCREEDYLSEPEMVQKSSSSSEEARLINIIIVRRGKCSFTTKVRVAYKKGAHAVLFVDREDSDLTAKDLRNIIVADDGFGQDIHIPSVLISKEDGRRLIEAAKAYQVIVELAWDLPTDATVKMDLWMSSASQESLRFLKEFGPRRRALNKVMAFNPHYVVFGVEEKSPGVYNEVCSDQTGKYCAEDPDGPGPITGREVIREDVRQLCIHEHYRRRTNKGTVMYAAEFWNYIEKFLDRCPLQADNPSDRFGEPCAQKLMEEVGIDTDMVDQCMQRSTGDKLKHELENGAWSPRALRINGWRYSGILDPDLVTRAVCSAFTHQPQECRDLIHPRNPFEVYSGGQQVHGVSFATLIGWICGSVTLCMVALLLYKRFLKKEMRSALREEVMLEVQAQMGAYRKMGE